MELNYATSNLDHFVVTERLGNDEEFHALGSDLTMDGLQLDTPPETLAEHRYMWLEFGQEGRDRIKALGEIVDRHEAGVRIKFKHLFPDHRRKLAIMLDEDLH